MALFLNQKFGHKLIAYAVLAGQHSGGPVALSGSLLKYSFRENRRISMLFFAACRREVTHAFHRNLISIRVSTR
jgi:hypothetical protein